MKRRLSKLRRNQRIRLVVVLAIMIILLASPYKHISRLLGIEDADLIQLLEVVVTAVGALIVIFELRSGEHLNCCGMLAEMNFKFIENDRLMLLYQKLEECYRDPSKHLEISEGWETDKIHDSDLMAYLTFYEVMFEHVDHGIISIEQMDDLFGDRFFKIVHNEYVQCNELYPQPSSYSNIFQLYNMWADYREICAMKNKSRHVALPENRIPKLYFEKNMYLNDTLYLKPDMGKVTLKNRQGNKIEFSKKRLFPYNLKEATNLQNEILEDFPEGSSVFKYSSENEILESMLLDYCYGLYDGAKLAAFCICVLNRKSSRNLCNNTGDEFYDLYITFDTIQVRKEYRGYGIQRHFLNDAEALAGRIKQEQGFSEMKIIATVSPDNKKSLGNFLIQGYRVVDTISIYDSCRNIVTKPV